MTDEVSQSEIRDRLDNILDPCSEANGSNLSIVEMGLIDEIRIDDGHVEVDIRLTSPHCMMLPVFVDGVHDQVEPLAGVESVAVNFDEGLEWTDEMITPSGQSKRERAMNQRQPTTTPQESDS